MSDIVLPPMDSLAALQTVAAIGLFAWVVLVAFRGGFWQADVFLPRWRPDRPVPLSHWPEVVAVVPARNEAAVIGSALASLFAQDYPRPLHVVLVDDNSDDGTADAANAAATTAGAMDRLHIVTAPSLPDGWAGKVWAMHSGVTAAQSLFPEASHILLTDADIGHHPTNLRELALRAETPAVDGRKPVLVSLMVRLVDAHPAERLLIPAFVYFFMKLYPFRWVNDPRRQVAAAAGGCMLVERAALTRAGGMTAIAGQIIDDCALAGRLKREGPIWLGLTRRTHSLRGYGSLGGVWRMVQRSAYTQLQHSPLLLVGTVLGMLLLYAVPPVSAILGAVVGDWLLELCGAGAWFMMVLSQRPVLRLYGRSGWQGLALPVAGMLYTAMTISSAVAHWRGRGGGWKGRFNRRPPRHGAA